MRTASVSKSTQVHASSLNGSQFIQLNASLLVSAASCVEIWLEVQVRNNALNCNANLLIGCAAVSSCSRVAHHLGPSAAYISNAMGLGLGQENPLID